MLNNLAMVSNYYTAPGAKCNGGYILARIIQRDSAASADPVLRRASGQRARPSNPHRTARVRTLSSRLRALASQRGLAILRRTVMNSAGYHLSDGLPLTSSPLILLRI